MWLNKALEEIGVGRFHLLQNLLVGMILFAEGEEVLMVSAVMSAMEERWLFPPMLRGAAVSLVMCGVLLGGFVSGPVADSIGRRPTLIACVAAVPCIGALTAVSSGPVPYLACRVLMGVVVGAGTSPSVALVAETCSTGMRAHLVNWNQAWFVLGEICICVLLLLYLPTLSGDVPGSWRQVTLRASIPCAVTLPFMLWFMEESPYYLEAAGRRQEAIEVLQRMAKCNGRPALVLEPPHDDEGDSDNDEEGQASDESRSTDAQSRGSRSGSLPRRVGDPNLSPRLPAVVETWAPGPADAKPSPRRAASLRGRGAVGDAEEHLNCIERYRAIFSPALRNIVAGGAYFCFLANFLLYGLNFALPQVFMHVEARLHVGISPVVQTLIACFSDLPGMAVVSFFLLLNNFGHRDGLIGLAMASTVLQSCMSTIDSGTKYLWIALPATYMSKFVSNALFILTYIYLSEVFPLECRCTALAFCVAAGRIGAILAPVIFEALNVLSGPAAFMPLNAGLCALGVFVGKRLLTFELKNTPLDDNRVRLLRRRNSDPCLGTRGDLEAAVREAQVSPRRATTGHFSAQGRSKLQAARPPRESLARLPLDSTRGFGTFSRGGSRTDAARAG